MVILVETDFKKHHQELFLFLLQMDEFSAMQEVVLVSQRPVWLVESSFCPPLCQAE